MRFQLNHETRIKCVAHCFRRHSNNLSTKTKILGWVLGLITTHNLLYCLLLSKIVFTLFDSMVLFRVGVKL